MSIARLAATAALVLPAAAFAANTLNVAVSRCSGSLVSSFEGGLSLACTGDLLLGQGSLWSDTDILLSATGSLQLIDVALNAHTITLSAGTVLDIDAGSTLKLNDAVLQGDLTPVTGEAILRAGGGIELRQPLTRDVIHWQTLDIGTGGTVQVTQPGTIRLGEVPEPASLALLLAGMVVLGMRCRRA